MEPGSKRLCSATLKIPGSSAEKACRPVNAPRLAGTLSTPAMAGQSVKRRQSGKHVVLVAEGAGCEERAKCATCVLSPDIHGLGCFCQLNIPGDDQRAAGRKGRQQGKTVGNPVTQQKAATFTADLTERGHNPDDKGTPAAWIHFKKSPPKPCKNIERKSLPHQLT